MSMRRVASLIVLVAVLASAADEAHAGRRRCGRCVTAAAPCAGCSTAAPCASAEPAPAPEAAAPAAPTMVEKTILVPEVDTVMKTIMVTACRPETRERTITVNRRVPKTETVTCNVTVMMPQAQTRTVNYTVRKPVYIDKEVTYNVCVPHQVEKTGVRKVCKIVPVTKTRTICVDEGHWEDVAPAPAAGCGDCAPCTSGCAPCRRARRCCAPCATACGPSRQWVSNVVKKEVPYVCYERHYEDQPYTKTVTVYKQEPRIKAVRLCNWVCETKTREVSCTVMVPQQKTVTREVTRWECVAEQRTQTYTVNVPYQVEKQVPVCVTKMVAKKIMVPAQDCSSAGACDTGCGEAAACDTGCGVGRGCGRMRRCRRGC